MIFFLLTLYSANSSTASKCRQDGTCDLKCNRKDLFYDFGDCNGCSPGCIDILLNNNHCEPQCFTSECSYDHLDCFNNCNENCDESFIGDGFCDFECNTESCGFDGGDCEFYCSEGCLTSQLGDGLCDLNCLTQECQLDLGDCDFHLYISQNSSGDGSETSPFGSIDEALNSIYSEGLFFLHLSPGIHYLTQTVFFDFDVGLALIGDRTEIRTHRISTAFEMSNLKYFSVSDVEFDGSEMFELNCKKKICMFVFSWECADELCWNFDGELATENEINSFDYRDFCSSKDSLVIFSLINVKNSHFHGIHVRRYGHFGSFVKATQSGVEVVNVTFDNCEMFADVFSVSDPQAKTLKRFVNNIEQKFSTSYNTAKVVIKNVVFNEINSKNSNFVRYPCVDPVIFQGISLNMIENALIENITFNRVIINNSGYLSLIFLKKLSQFSVSSIHVSNSSLINMNVVKLEHLSNFLAINKSKSLIDGVHLSKSEFYSNILFLKLQMLMNDILIQNIHFVESNMNFEALINVSNYDIFPLPAEVVFNSKKKYISAGPKLKINSVNVTNSRVSLKMIHLEENFDTFISNVTIFKTFGELQSSLLDPEFYSSNFLPGFFYFKNNENVLVTQVQVYESFFEHSIIEIYSLKGLHEFSKIEVQNSGGLSGVFINASSSHSVQLNNFLFFNTSYKNASIFSENAQNLTINNSKFLELKQPAIKVKASELLIKFSVFQHSTSLESLVTLEPLNYSSKLLVEQCSFLNNSGIGPVDVFLKSSEKLDSEIVFKSSNFSLASAKSPSSLSTDLNTTLKLVKFEDCLITSMISTNYRGIFYFNMLQGQVTFIRSSFISNKKSLRNSPIIFFNNENSDQLSFINCEVSENSNDVFLIHQNPNILQKSIWKSVKFSKNQGKVFSLENALAMIENCEFDQNQPEFNLISVHQNSFLIVSNSIFSQNILQNKGSLIDFSYVENSTMSQVILKKNDCKNRALISIYSGKTFFEGLVTESNQASSIFELGYSESHFTNVSTLNDGGRVYITAVSSEIEIEKSQYSDISSFLQMTETNITLNDIDLTNITDSLLDLSSSSLTSSSLRISSSKGQLHSASSSLVFDDLLLEDSLSTSIHDSKITFTESRINNLHSMILSNSELVITSSTLTQGKSSLLIEKSKTLITSSNFSSFRNSVFQVINSTFQCTDCKFQNNSGNQGGCIFSSNSEVFLDSSTFKNNKALQGGVIFHSDCKISISNCSYENNYAVHGPIQATPLLEIIPSNSNNYSQTSGEGLKSLLFLLQDSLNQTISSDNFTSFEIQALNSSAVLKGPKNLLSNQGVLSTEGLTILTEPGKSIEFQIISADSLKLHSFELSFRECVVGEVLSRENSCKVCENNTYSLNVNDRFCKACPGSAVCKGKNLIFPAAGYWAHPSFPENFYPCSNRKACLEGAEGVESNCAYSYTGTLCGSCLPGFKLKGSYNCTKCPEYWLSWLIVSVAGAIIAGLISFMVFSNIKNTNKPKSEIALLLKILVHYCQNILVLASIDLKWPTSILYLFDFSTAVGESSTQVINLSCSEINSSQDSFVTSNAVTVLFPFVLITVIFIVWTIIGLVKKTSKYMKVHFVSTCVVVVLLFHTSVSNSILSIFSCKKINDEYWNTSNLSTKCFEGSHMKGLLYVGVPGLVIWCVSVPVIIFSSLFFHRKNLMDVNNMIKYKMLFAGYKQEFFYWELLIIIRKFLIRVVSILLISAGITVQGLGIMVILIFSLTIHVNFRPYEKESINKLERYCIFVLILYSCGGIIFSTDISEDSKIVIGWLLFILNLLFLIYWSKFFFTSVFSVVMSTKIFNKLKEKILLRKKCKISINNEEGIKVDCTYKSNNEDFADKSIDILCPKNPYNSFMENEQVGNQPRVNVWTVNQID